MKIGKYYITINKPRMISWVCGILDGLIIGWFIFK